MNRPPGARRRHLAPVRLLVTALVAVLAGLAVASPASAHPVLVQSDPAAGSVAAHSPEAITLSFTEPVEVAGSKVNVRRLDGHVVTLGSLARGLNEATLTVPVNDDLSGAVYHVEWSILGADGHRQGGRIGFGVADPSGAVPEGIEQVRADTAGGPENDQGVSVGGVVAVLFRWAGLLGAAVMLGGWLLTTRALALGVSAPGRWARRVTAAAWLAALGAAVESAVVLTVTGGRQFSPGLLTSTATGVASLVSIAALGLLVVCARRWSRPALVGAAGAVVLAASALDGHTAAVTSGRAVAWAEAVMHAEAAGVWAGGLVTWALWSLQGGVDTRRLLRAFSPIALISTVVLAVTGVLMALREVGGWIFLRWSSYGNIVGVKVMLLLCALALAGLVRWWRVRATGGAGAAAVWPPEPSRARPPRLSAAVARLVRLDAVLAVSLLALGAALGQLTPGADQTAFAQRGDLMTGPAMATVPTSEGLLHLTVAPGREGANTIVAVPLSLRDGAAPQRPASIHVRLSCGCAEGGLRAQLRETSHGVWSAEIDLPDNGGWEADLEVDSTSSASSVPLRIHDPLDEAGPRPLTVGATADLTGERASECRAFVQGLALGIGRLNANGGVDGGRKVALDVRDDGGDPDRAEEPTREVDADVLAPCGAGGLGAVRVGDGALTLIGDPAIPPTEGAEEGRLFRLALDPYAEGVGIGRFLEQSRRDGPDGDSRRVAVVVRGAAGEERLAGLQEALGTSDIIIEPISPSAAESASTLKRITDPRTYVATLLDGGARPVGEALDVLGDDPHYVPTLVFLAPRLATEQFVLSAGRLGRQSVLKAGVEVVPDSRDGQAYANAVGVVFTGDQARISGLRGYTTALTLAEAVRDGTGLSEMAGRLRRPSRYTDALSMTWLEDAPARGTQGFVLYAPTFVPPNLTPVSMGGMAFSGRFFTSGTWTRLSEYTYGPLLDTAAADG